MLQRTEQAGDLSYDGPNPAGSAAPRSAVLTSSIFTPSSDPTGASSSAGSSRL